MNLQHLLNKLAAKAAGKPAEELPPVCKMPGNLAEANATALDMLPSHPIDEKGRGRPKGALTYDFVIAVTCNDRTKVHMVQATNERGALHKVWRALSAES